jgi:hypothetical protein
MISVRDQTEVPVTSSVGGRIVVRRSPGAYRDLLRRYKVEVDGVVRGSVGRGGQLEIDVPAGSHDVRAKIDWTGSPALPVEVIPGQTVTLRVEPNGNLLKAILQVWGGGTYLRLVPEASA